MWNVTVVTLIVLVLNTVPVLTGTFRNPYLIMKGHELQRQQGQRLLRFLKKESIGKDKKIPPATSTPTMTPSLLPSLAPTSVAPSLTVTTTVTDAPIKIVDVVGLAAPVVASASPTHVVIMLDSVTSSRPTDPRMTPAPTSEPTQDNKGLLFLPDKHNNENDGSFMHKQQHVHDDDEITISIPLQPFRLDFLSTINLSALTSGKKSTNAPSDRPQRRFRFLRENSISTNITSTTDSVTTSQSSIIPLLFQPAQDLTLLSFISYHLLTFYQTFIEPTTSSLSTVSDDHRSSITSVELEVVEKSEAHYNNNRYLHQQRDFVRRTSNVNNNITAHSFSVQDPHETNLTSIIVSYTFAGSAIYAAPVNRSNSDRNSSSVHFPPSKTELQQQTLEALASTKGKAELIRTLSNSEDAVLRAIIDVNAIFLAPNSKQKNYITDVIATTGNEIRSEENNKDQVLLFAVITICFLFTITLLGFLTLKRYRQLQREIITTSDNNDIHNPQKTSRKLLQSADTPHSNKKRRPGYHARYNQFESPESSVITENESPPNSHDIDSCVGVVSGFVGSSLMTLATSCTTGIPSLENPLESEEDEEDTDDDNGWSSTSTSTDVLDWNVGTNGGSCSIDDSNIFPYDEKESIHTKKIASSISCLGVANTSKLVPSSYTIESEINHPHLLLDSTDHFESQVQIVDDATLEGMYSDKDSYFESGTLPKDCSSFDTLNFSVDHSTFGNGWEKDVVVDAQLTEKSHDIVGSQSSSDGSSFTKQEEGYKFSVDHEGLMTEITKIILENNAKPSDCNSCRGNQLEDQNDPDDLIKIILDNNLPCLGSHNQYSQGKSEAMSRDQLHDRISELENMPFVTEDQTSTKNDKTPQTLKKLHPSIALTVTSKHLEESAMSKDNHPKNYFLSRHSSKDAYKLLYNGPTDPSYNSKINISAGIFTQETLGMINRNRLKATPPPSEGEFDEDVIQEAKNNTLLGWMVDTDSDEDSLFQK